MTQEQRINRGTTVIFILSVVLLLCLCLSATLAYFAGNQSSKTTLILGGPVRVAMVNNDFDNTFGQGNLVMDIKANRDTLLPGMGIDMQAIAKLTSSGVSPTPALLRAILDVEVNGASENIAREVEKQVRDAMGECLTYRIDSTQVGARDGWVLFDDGYYYYCSMTKVVDPNTNLEYVELKSIATGDTGNNVSFINGTFQFPYKAYTNKYSNLTISFTLTFQAIQNRFLDDNGNEIPNTIFNVKQILDSVDWNKHNF